MPPIGTPALRSLIRQSLDLGAAGLNRDPSVEQEDAERTERKTKAVHVLDQRRTDSPLGDATVTNIADPEDSAAGDGNDPSRCEITGDPFEGLGRFTALHAV